MKKKFRVKYKEGLHMRPISKMVEIARGYKNTAYVIVNKKKVNMKSLVEMILLDVRHNDIVEVEVIGKGAKFMFEVISKLEVEEL